MRDEPLYGMHWSQASNVLLNYYNLCKEVDVPKWDDEQERIDRSVDNTVITVEVDSTEGDGFGHLY